MNRGDKIKNRLMEIWNDLDEAYECMERSIDKLSVIKGLSDDFMDEIDKIDISAISNLKQKVEVLLDEVAPNAFKEEYYDCWAAGLFGEIVGI